MNKDLRRRPCIRLGREGLLVVVRDEGKAGWIYWRGYGIDVEDPLKKGLVVGLISLKKSRSKEKSCREFDSSL